MTATVETYNENRRKVHSAILFSSSSEDVIDKTKDDLLTRFGVDVQEVMPIERQRGIKDAMSRYDLVFLHENNQKDAGRIKKIAEDLELEIVSIGRKDATWEDHLLHKLQPHSKRVIADENMESFLREFVMLKERGYSLAQMCEPLSRFRVSGKFNTPQQVAVVTSLAKMGDRAPSWFRDWHKEFVAPKELPSDADVTGDVVADDDKKLTVYANENADLREKLAELEDQNKVLVSAIKVLDAVKLLVDEGAISKESGFDMIVKAMGK